MARRRRTRGGDTVTLSANSPEIRDLVAAYEENRNLGSFGYLRNAYPYTIVAIDRRKYVAIDETCGEVHHSGRFLVDRATGEVYSIRGYGQRGHRVGTVAGLTEQY